MALEYQLTYTRAEVQEKLDKIDNIPSKVSDLENDAGYATQTYVDEASAAVKNDLLNGAGEAYDTLKELGELIDENTDAIDALNTVAAGKADKDHTHNDLYTTQDYVDNAIASAIGSSSSGWTIGSGSVANNILTVFPPDGTSFSDWTYIKASVVCSSNYMTPNFMYYLPIKIANLQAGSYWLGIGYVGYSGSGTSGDINYKQNEVTFNTNSMSVYVGDYYENFTEGSSSYWGTICVEFM